MCWWRNADTRTAPTSRVATKECLLQPMQESIRLGQNLFRLPSGRKGIWDASPNGSSPIGSHRSYLKVRGCTNDERPLRSVKESIRDGGSGRRPDLARKCCWSVTGIARSPVGRRHISTKATRRADVLHLDDHYRSNGLAARCSRLFWFGTCTKLKGTTTRQAVDIANRYQPLPLRGV